MFRWFPACGVRGVVKALPFNKVEQSQSFATSVESAVKNPIHFPFVGVFQLNWWQWVNHSVGDLTRAGRLQ